MILHPFPTRRSSDLRPPAARKRGPAAQPAGGFRAFGPLGGRAAAAPAPGARDRKSTRLNSSHVAISYAVFCLKKKRKIQMTLDFDHVKNINLLMQL